MSGSRLKIWSTFVRVFFRIESSLLGYRNYSKDRVSTWLAQNLTFPLPSCMLNIPKSHSTNKSLHMLYPVCTRLCIFALTTNFYNASISCQLLECCQIVTNPARSNFLLACSNSCVLRNAHCSAWGFLLAHLNQPSTDIIKPYLFLSTVSFLLSTMFLSMSNFQAFCNFVILSNDIQSFIALFQQHSPG